MSKETVHFEALGYEPFRMKPVHFAAGFFLSLTNARYELEMLNKTAVIKHKTGLRGDYAHDNLRGLLCEQQILAPSVSVDELKLLRVQLNGILGNDDAIYGSFKPYKKPPGVAYTVVSSRYLYDEQPLDGFSGYFVHQVLAHTTQGTAVLDFARMRMEHHASTLEQLVAPLLDGEGERQPFEFDYEQTFGKLNAQRLGNIAADMAAQTQALEVLCQNLAEHASHATQLRGLTIGLCSWLFVYLHRRATAAHGLSQRAPLFLMDFLGGSNPRLRAASRLSFARQRGLVFESYKAFRARKVVEFMDTDFSPKGVGSADFSFLEQHYSDLAVRIGFAQPRTFQAKRKHFELQPDTARLLVQSVISPTQPLVTVEEVANALRKVWGVSFGGCDDDLAVLRDYGHTGFDEDDDLKPNREAFVDLLKQLNLAAEPSDGLVLCAVKPEGTAMTREQWLAEALVAWLPQALHTGRDVAREGLPMMDVAHFLGGLAAMPGFRAEEVSLALAGFKLTATDLRALADANGLRKLRHVAADLNTAAWWRNEHQKHPRILAFARGRHPGVHTLRHFAPARSRELARALLLSAAQDAGFTGGRSRHRELLERLANTPELEPLRSLETVADFLAAWSQHAVSATDDAPLRALPVLGLLADDQIFATSKNVELRLVRNLEVIQTILDARRHQLARLRDQFGKWKNRTQRNNLLDLLNRAEALQRQPTTENRAALSLADAETIFHPPKEASPEPTNEPESETPSEDDDDDEHSGELNERKLSRATSEALLDNRQEELEAAAEAMEEALHQAITRDGKQAEGSVEFRGETREFCVKLDSRLGGWLHKFCADDAWGGVIESSETALDLALAHCESGAIEPKILSADAVARPEEREPLSMSELLRAWDEDLTEEAPGLALAQKWERFVALRSELVQHLDALVYLPSTWLAGKPALAGTLTEYLKLSGEIYGALQRCYRAMADHSQSWARAAIEAALAIDVLQVRIALPDGKEAYKAILLPTHPLHLWRRQRLTSVLRGLGENLDTRDREAILRESERPEHFLSVISVGSIPAGRGVNQILPVANDLHGMATFENLLNAYGGPDGADTLAYAINRFAVLGRQHARPMRVVIVNPPDAPRLLAKIVSVFKQRRRETLPCLSLELYATTDHAARIQAAMRFDGEVRELLEDPIAAGRLRFRADEKPRKLAELLVELGTHPCHILAIFDEATIRIRRRGTGRHLPMSPFCVRHEITFDRRENVLRLSPTTDEPPFSEFMQLINEAESGQRDSSPHAWADAESLRQVVDDVLQGNSACARWLFLANRALPAESGLKSVRLLQKRDGHRQVLLATANHERMARLVRGVFDRSGLSLSSDELQRLLEEGVNLSGAGLLDLIKEDGLPDRSKVVGLAGALVASRDYRRRHPECLLVSVDNEVARLWLRLGRSGDRCDLIGVRREGDTFVVEAIEVKATEDVEAKALSESVRRAQEQITAVLTAVAAAMPDGPTGNSPLSAPRCEMLKEVLVRGCQSRALPPEKRAMWSGWLKELFRQEGNVKPVVKFSGEVICVLPRAAAAPADKALANNQFPITARYLCAEHIEDLLRDATRPPEGPDSPPTPPPPRKPSPALEDVTKSSSATPPAKIEAARPAPPPPPRQQPATNTAAPRKDASSVIWPPHLNALGMIGQAEAVQQLISQVNYAKAASRRFSDKLLVGSAGVGKTSLARAIARQLLGEGEILFNGSDLRQPTAVITRLKERKKLPSRAHGTVKVQPCLIFIDEVHAISNNVETTLLSALEGDRTTSIESVLYDFSDVVFILATTDSGRLGGAFNSRPDKLYLRNYTLDEMAGIIWLRGKEELGGEELSRTVCFEIAARMRCRPRESVNCLRQRLVPYFHSRTHQAGHAVDFSRIAAAMTPQAVAEYFDTQGIDLNGLDVLTRNYLQHIAKSGAQSEERLRSALGISNRGDFIEVDEYLTVRLRLVTISSAGRSLTADGRKYINAPFDLRERISRQT